MGINRIEKAELKYLGIALLVISVLLFMINNDTAYNYISSFSTLFQFAVVNLGIYFVFFFLIKYISLGASKVPEFSLGSIMVFIAMDLVLPEYHVNTHGLVVGGLFGVGATDYFFGSIYQYMGFSGLGLVIMTYIVTFAVLFIGGAYIIKGLVYKI